MKNQPVVYVLCGFIGSGKTTFARTLEQQTGAVRITKDEWLIRLIGNDPAIEGYEELDHKICGLSRDLAFDLLGKGIDVIIDEGFWEREQRDNIRERITASGAKGVMYFLDTPIDTIRERVAARNAHLSKDSFQISREMLDNYLMYWQPPGEDEELILVRESDTACTAPGGPFPSGNPSWKESIMPLTGEYEPGPAGRSRSQAEKYEASGGAEANTLFGKPIVVVTMVGAKSGKLRKVPLMRVEHDGEYAIVASVGGEPRNPIWYHNLKQNPHVELQDGAVRKDYLAREVTGEEKATWWKRAVAAYPPYADYQKKTERHIPVFVLTPMDE